MNDTPLSPQTPDPSDQNPVQQPAPQQPEAPAQQQQLDAAQQPVAPQQPQFQTPQFQTPQQPTAPQHFPEQPAVPGYAAPQQPESPQYPVQAPQAAPASPYGSAQEPTHQQFAAPGAPGGPGGPGSPVPPGTAGAPRKKGLSTGALIGIIAGGLVLILLIVGVVFVLLPKFGNNDASGTGKSDTAKVDEAKTPEAAVEQYLNALAEGDATTARKIVGGSANDPLLTDEVLAQSNELAPLTDIVVEEAVKADYKATVSASFKLGDQTVSRDFDVYDYSSGWEITGALNSLSVSQFAGLELTVNGAKVTDEYPEAFIGAYKFELGVDEFELSGESDVFIIGSDDDAQALYEVKPQLTEDATEEFRELVRASLNKCLESKGLETECGLSVSGEVDGVTVKDGTVTRTLTPEGDAALKKVVPEADYSDPSIVSTYEYIRIEIVAEFSDGTTGTLYGGKTALLQPHVDFSEETPVVSWQ